MGLQCESGTDNIKVLNDTFENFCAADGWMQNNVSKSYCSMGGAASLSSQPVQIPFRFTEDLHLVNKSNNKEPVTHANNWSWAHKTSTRILFRQIGPLP